MTFFSPQPFLNVIILYRLRHDQKVIFIQVGAVVTNTDFHVVYYSSNSISTHKKRKSHKTVVFIYQSFPNETEIVCMVSRTSFNIMDRDRKTFNFLSSATVLKITINHFKKIVHQRWFDYNCLRASNNRRTQSLAMTNEFERFFRHTVYSLLLY